MGSSAQATNFPDDTPVYYDGGKRGHIGDCRRLSDERKAHGPTATLAEMKAKGGLLCSRCPGSALNVEREAGGANKTSSSVQAKDFPNDAPVYYQGGKRGHIGDCRRVSPEAKAAGPNTTYAEMRAKGGLLCSRCPGSALNVEREAGSGKQASRQKMTRGEKARAKRLQGPAVAYDPSTVVYMDALWYRAHAEDCSALLLKEHKQTMTLAEADKAGYRIGESGQSGRDNCCFIGYRAKHPLKEMPDDALLAGSDNPRHSRCYPGCHRRQMTNNFTRKTKAQWIEEGFKICDHCIERGPSNATISNENWKQLPKVEEYGAPKGWVHKAYSTDQLPSKEEIEILIRETLSRGSAIQELPFDNTVASVEQFATMRFFFPIDQWLHLYKVYRATGDQRVYDLLLESARHYNELSKAYPAAVQKKASDPEGLPYMYTMAMCSRITLQKAQKDPSSVTEVELAEVEDFLNTMVSVLKPTYGGNDNLDSEMGIPQAVADDFRSRAYNRAMNGIGTLATIAATLEDLQTIKNANPYQPTIDRYRKTVREYVKNWFGESHFCEFGSKNHFYYPYNSGKIGESNGCVIFKRPEDGGHYSHGMQGAMLVYEAMPESGIDDAFMTAVANALHHNSTTKIRRDGKMVLSGHVECPNQSGKRPYGSNKGSHQYSPARDRFYMLQAFRGDMIDGLCDPLNEQEQEALNSEYDKRLATLHAQYMQALTQDRSTVHLGR